MNLAGNCMNHPERIQPDRHRAGSPLPRANLHNSIGYLPDGTPLNAAGNAINHPERMKPDKHVSGSPLPKSVHSADVGYLADGTDLKTAGNNFVRAPRAQTEPSQAEARSQLRLSMLRRPCITPTVSPTPCSGMSMRTSCSSTRLAAACFEGSSF